MKANIINEEPMTLVEVKQELDSVREREGELNFRAAKTAEYLKEFTHLPLDKTQELMKELDGLGITRLRAQHIAKLCDILPAKTQDVKVVLASYNVTLSQEHLKKVADTLAKYASKE